MHSVLKRFPLPISLNLLLILMLWAGNALAAQLLDRIVGVVNDNVITERQLIAETRLVAQQIGAANDPNFDMDALARQVLDRMITTEVQVQRAASLGIRVDDTTLERTITNIAQQNGLTLPQLQQVLEAQGIAFREYRNQIRNEITIQQLHQREIFERIHVSDREIDEYLARFANNDQQQEYWLKHILIAVPENARPEEVAAARDKAQAVLAALQNQDFDTVSVEFSDAPNALDGGDLGWRDLSRIPTLFVDTVQKMNAGEISEPIRSPNGFHILKVEQIRNKAALEVVESRVRHVLIQPSNTLSNEDARRQAEQLREAVLRGEDFAEIARNHSADRGSAERGGDLGWVKPGVMVPEFEQMIMQTRIGEISPVFRSQFGWHFLRVEDRRQARISPDELRAQARQAIMERKAEEELISWIRRQRAEAYIETRL